MPSWADGEPLGSKLAVWRLSITINQCAHLSKYSNVVAPRPRPAFHLICLLLRSLPSLTPYILLRVAMARSTLLQRLLQTVLLCLCATYTSALTLDPTSAGE